MNSNHGAWQSRRRFLGKALSSLSAIGLASSLMHKARKTDALSFVASSPPAAGHGKPKLLTARGREVRFSDPTDSFIIKRCAFDASPSAAIVLENNRR
jgi:hypothetical protein